MILGRQAFCGKHSVSRRSMASTTTGLASSSSSRARSGGHKRPGQDLERTVVLAQPAAAPSFPNVNNNTANASNNHSASRMAVDSSSSQARVPQQPEPVPLKYVVQEAVKRWFDDTHQEAQRGDVKQQALLGQMYLEGYGCTKDVKLAKEWADKASSRGYKMAGVYCSMP